MNTVRLETIYVLQFQLPPPDVPCRGSPNEQVWSGLQWSPLDVTSRRSPGLMSGSKGYPTWSFDGGALPYDISHDAFDITRASLPWTDRFLLKHYHPATSFAGGKNTIATRYTGRQSRFQTTGNYIMVYLTGVTRSSAIRFVIPVLTCGIKHLCSYWLCPSLAFCFYWVNNHIRSDFHHGNQK